MAACPSSARLESHARASRPEASLQNHIARCAACRELIEEIQENQKFLDAAGPALVDALDAANQAEEATGKCDRDSTRGGGVSPPEPGSIRGYELVEEIGRGGQGVIYRAVQEATKRPAAVKMLITGSFASQRQRQRFEREVELAARLRHPNLVTIFDSGHTSTGCLYVAMELVNGVRLDRYVEQSLGRPSHAGRTRATVRRRVRAVMQLFARICDAVGHAHTSGVVHRDLKPSNILVDSKGDPHVLDFGLARTADAGHDVTVTQEFVGTPAFASPEQFSADPASINARSDVYALGLILYHALTGRHPYPCDGPFVYLARHALETPPAPPSRYEPTIPMDVQTIVLKCLSKDPARRYATAAALQADINDYLAGRPISARRDSPMYMLGKMSMKYRIPAVAACTALTAVIGATTGAALIARGRNIADKAPETVLSGGARLGGVANVGGRLVLLADQLVLYEGLSAQGEQACGAPSWQPAPIHPTSLSEPVYDARRRRLVGIGDSALEILTRSADGTWWATSIPLSVPMHPRGRISIDTRDLGQDAAATSIYFRASNGRIYLWEYAVVLKTPIAVYGWNLTEITRIAGGAPVFDNFNMNERSLFFRAEDETLRRCVYDPRTRQWATSSLPAKSVHADPVVNGSRSVIFADREGRVNSTWWEREAWNTEQWNQTANVAGPLAIGVDAGVVFYADAGNNLWKCAWGGSGFVSTKLTSTGNVRPDSLVVNSTGQVFYRGMDNCLWRY